MFDIDYEIGDAYARVGEHDNAIPYLKRSIKHNNNPYAWNDLAVIYEKEGQYKDAHECYLKSIENGAKMGFTNIGLMYEHGLGIKKNYDKAKEFYNSGIKAKDSRSYNRMASLYMRGVGVEKNIEKGITLIKKGAKIEQENGYSSIHNTSDLAYYYSQGIGTRYSPKKAADLWKILADYGDLNALYNLSVALLKGKGIERNVPQAISILIDLAINKHYGHSFEMLGCIYDEGKYLPMSKFDCARWLVEGASFGDLGSMLYIIDICLSKSEKELKNYKFNREKSLNTAITDFWSTVYGEEDDYLLELNRYNEIKSKYPDSIDWEGLESKSICHGDGNSNLS